MTFYCLLIQTLALTDQGKLHFFALWCHPCALGIKRNVQNKRVVGGSEWKHCSEIDVFQEKKGKTRKTRQKNLLHRQLKRQPWMEGKPIQNQEIQVRRALLSSPPEVFKWQNHVQAKVCRRVHLCCHKLVSECREFPALLLETLSSVSSRAHGRFVSLPPSLMWDLLEVCTKFSRLFTPEVFDQLPANSLSIKLFPFL